MDNDIEARPNPTLRQSLGVGGILGQTFSLLFSRYGTFLMMAFVPLMIVAVIGTQVGPTLLDGMVASMTAANSTVGFLLNPYGLVIILAFLLVFNIITAAITAATYDSLTGRPLRVVGYYLRALAATLPIAILGGVVIALLILGAWLFLLVLAPLVPVLAWLAMMVWVLYIVACFYVLIPVIVIEKAGFAGLGRTLEATRGYRWPVAGLIFVTWFLSNIFNWLIERLNDWVVEAFGPGLWVILAFSCLGFTFIYAAGAILSALVYARLREIKQGVGLDDLAEVFR